jgi:branched-chain amino acid transport system substrate-binding protein
MKKWLRNISILSVCLLLFVACNKNSNTSSNDSKGKSQGVKDDEILIGGWVPQSGPAAQWGILGEVYQSYFNKVNAEGGVNGRTLKYIAIDDEYQPSKTVAAAKKLVEEDKVFAILGTTGTAHNKAVMPYLTKKGIPVVAVASGDSAFVDPPVKNYFALQTNYDIEARIFSTYANDELKAKSVGIFYQNDDYGIVYKDAAVEELNKLGIKVATQEPFNVTDVDFSSQALSIKKANPDVVFLFASPKPAASFLKEFDKIGGSADRMLTYTSADQTMIDLAGEDVMEGVFSTTWVKSLNDSEDPLIKEYVDQLKKDLPNEDPNSVFMRSAWAYAQVLVEGLKRSGDNLTWENFIKQMETLEDWNGSLAYNVTYSSQYRYGQTSVKVSQFKDGNIVDISDVIKYEP